MIKYIINTFVAIAACLGIAAFVLVLTSKQPKKCKQNKEGYLMEVGHDWGDECWGSGSCKDPPGPKTLCKNSDCTDCSGWDLNVECDSEAKGEHRCVATTAGGFFYTDGDGYGNGYLCSHCKGDCH